MWEFQDWLIDVFTWHVYYKVIVIKHVGFGYQLSTVSARSQVVIEVWPRMLRHVSLQNVFTVAIDSQKQLVVSSVKQFTQCWLAVITVT